MNESVLTDSFLSTARRGPSRVGLRYGGRGLEKAPGALGDPKASRTLRGLLDCSDPPATDIVCDSVQMWGIYVRKPWFPPRFPLIYFLTVSNIEKHK